MKYATQNMPNIVSLENGNEEAVKHKRKCSTISVPNSPRSLILETGVFEKYTPKSYVFGDRLRRTCVAVKAIPRKERLGFQEIMMHLGEASNLFRPFYLLYLF